MVSLFGNKMRIKTANHIIQELKILVKVGYREVFLADDNLVGNRAVIKNLLTRIIEPRIPLFDFLPS